MPYYYDAFDLGILKEVKQSIYDDAITVGKTLHRRQKKKLTIGGKKQRHSTQLNNAKKHFS
jgi:hypothetical protein